MAGRPRHQCVSGGHFAFSDLRPAFEDCLREMRGGLGLDYKTAD
ncbi:hypothetical protein [Saccharopolyspora shandongensis]|nr:hypothetical protein [Saccharopolyspora shandongensis]